jgi:hypothetical protein
MMGSKQINGTGGPMAICLAYSKNPGAAYLINQLGVQSTVDFAKNAESKARFRPTHPLRWVLQIFH